MGVVAAYFVNELLIPGISGASYSEVENLNSLNLMIKKYEPKFLRLLLGENLYTKFAAAMLLNPTSGIWFDLNAKIYYEDTNSPAYYESPVANYVYFYFWKNNTSVTTKTGESQSKIENADVASIGSKMVRAWNEMVDFSEAIQQWIYGHETDYADWNTGDHWIFDKISIQC